MPAIRVSMGKEHTMADKYDLVVLGGGPAGYPAAIRARQLGLSVAVIERHKLGGTCLNRGCIPTKALIHTSRLYSEIAHAKQLGITVDGYSHDIAKVYGYKDRIVRKLVAGTKMLLNKNGADIIEGNGKLLDANTIDVDGTPIEFKNLLIAVGSKVRMLPAFPLDGKKIITSDQALELKELPPRIGIIGAGAIGMEFGGIFNAFGAQVTILELLPRPMPMDDPDVGKVMWDVYKRRKIDIRCGFNATSCRVEGDVVKVDGEQDGESSEFEFDLLLVSIGREASTKGCGFEEAGIELSRGSVVVDDNLRTKISHIYAAGDCAKPPLLAHKATAEGVYAAELIAGIERKPLNYDHIPAATYTWPEVGSVGVHEEEAIKRGLNYRTANYSLAGSGKALIDGSQEGFIKAVADKESGKLLGITVVGPNASELLAASVIAVTHGVTTEQLVHTIFAHPTVSEAFGELGHAFGDGALHLPPG